MPSGSYKQVYVRCPFFRSDDGGRHITCEGPTEESSLTLNFPRKAEFETQITVFCCDHYQNCEIYRMLMDKYQD